MTQGCMPKLTHPMYGYAKQNKNDSFFFDYGGRDNFTIIFYNFINKINI